MQPLETLIQGVKRLIVADPARKRTLDFKAVNLALIVLIVILAGYFLHTVVVSVKRIDSLAFGIPAQPRTASGTGVQEKQALQPLSYYMDKVKLRNIFRMGARAKEENVAEALSSKAAEATQSLRLVGISWSDDPDAMVEDTKALKTFFVKRGQLVGDLKVEAIYKDKVVLRYGQELVELR